MDAFLAIACAAAHVRGQDQEATVDEVLDDDVEPGRLLAFRAPVDKYDRWQRSATTHWPVGPDWNHYIVKAGKSQTFRLDEIRRRNGRSWDKRDLSNRLILSIVEPEVKIVLRALEAEHEMFGIRAPIHYVAARKYRRFKNH